MGESGGARPRIPVADRSDRILSQVLNIAPRRGWHGRDYIEDHSKGSAFAAACTAAHSVLPSVVECREDFMYPYIPGFTLWMGCDDILCPVAETNSLHVPEPSGFIKFNCREEWNRPIGTS